MLLRPVRFSYKEGKGPDGDQEGFIAHELQKVLPGSVSGDKDAIDPEGNPLLQSVDLSKITPLLTAAMQELKAANDNLKAENDNLRDELSNTVATQDAQIEFLRRKVEALEAAH